MNVRDLERLLSERGITRAKADGTTRRLRESGRLPKGGRGANAPSIGADEAAIILIAVAGSGKAGEADIRLKKLEVLTDSSGQCLREAVRSYLYDPSTLAGLAQVRVARTARHATILYEDGRAKEFLPETRHAHSDRFMVEGIISAELLRVVARAIVEPSSVSRDRPSDLRRDAEQPQADSDD